MSKHTPGPWNLIEGPGGMHREITDREGSAIMAETEYGEETPTNHADWELIAAAPEMLAALKQAAIDITEKLEESEELVDSPTIALIHAVIAKAEGH